MHDHAGGLVHRQHVLVLEQHVERDVHGAQFRRHHFWQGKLDHVPTRHVMRPIDGLAAHQHQPGVKRPLQGRAAVLAKSQGQRLVRPQPANALGNRVSLFHRTQVQAASTRSMRPVIS